LGVAKLYYGTGNIYGQNVVGDMVVFSSLSSLQPPERRAKGFKSPRYNMEKEGCRWGLNTLVVA